MNSLSTLLDERNLRHLAGGRSFERGADYAAAGAVARLTRGETSVEASVQGSHRYRVELWVEDGELGGRCSCPMGVDMASFRDAIDRAVDPGGFIGYAEAYDYARTVEETIASLRSVLVAGHAVEAVEVIEHCCGAIERTADRMDDSDGHLSVAFDSLQRLHREACEQADFAPTQLAERLFERMMATEYELFYDAAETYAPLLGEPGRRRYAELVRAEWERLPALRPEGDRRKGSAFSAAFEDEEDAEHNSRFRITYVMKLLAKQSEDPDELVAVLSHDLSLPYCFLGIAEVYAEAGRDDDAIEWAERGVEAFPDGGDSRLVTFLAAARSSRGEHARAAELMWSLYEAHPGLGYLEELKPYAEAAGTWDGVRGRALDLLRERIAAARDERRARGYGWSSLLDATELVRIRLWERDVNAALADAREGGCRQEVWLALAEALEEAEPWEAMIIYREQVEPTIERKRKADYREATDRLAKIRDLMDRTGHGDEFSVYLAEVREKHRRKRNLTKLLPELEDGRLPDGSKP